MNETYKDNLREAQHHLIQALGLMLEVKEDMDKYAHYLLGRLKTEIAAVNAVDNHIGRLISGRE